MIRYTNTIRKRILEENYTHIIDNTTLLWHLNEIQRKIKNQIKGVFSTKYDIVNKTLTINNSMNFYNTNNTHIDLTRFQHIYSYDFVPENDKSFSISFEVIVGDKNEFREVDISELKQYLNLKKINV